MSERPTVDWTQDESMGEVVISLPEGWSYESEDMPAELGDPPAVRILLYGPPTPNADEER